VPHVDVPDFLVVDAELPEVDVSEVELVDSRKMRPGHPPGL
jgi:hypothetical protein